ncbi:MAG: hypothetical protein OEL53_10640 [Rhodospirillales bacterium]|nr:hypothetical protein [Rhodospirillales bacterium]
MGAFFDFVRNHLFLTTFFAYSVQIVATVVLACFSFYGIKINVQNNVRTNGLPITHVSIDDHWFMFAKFALLGLVFGIFLSGLTTLAALPS